MTIPLAMPRRLPATVGPPSVALQASWGSRRPPRALALLDLAAPAVELHAEVPHEVHQAVLELVDLPGTIPQGDELLGPAGHAGAVDHAPAGQLVRQAGHHRSDRGEIVCLVDEPGQEQVGFVLAEPVQR